MSDLPISGMLEVEVDPASLRAAEDEIRELTTETVQVEVSGGDLDGLGAAGSGADVEKHLSTQLELDRERNLYLEEIADATGPGGGGLNGGRFRRLRGGDGGGLGGIGGILALLAGGTALAGGSALSSGGLSDLELPVEDPGKVGYGGPEQIGVEEPGDVGYSGPEQIGVEEPGDVGYSGPEQLGVEDPGDVGYSGPEQLGVEDPGEAEYSGPNPIEVEDPGTAETTVTVESPSGDTAVAGDPDPDGSGPGLPIGGIVASGAAGVVSAGSDLFSGSDSDGDLPGAAVGGLAAGGAAALASSGSELLSGLSAPKLGGVLPGSGVGFPSPGALVAGSAGRARQRDPENRGPIGSFLVDTLSGAGRRGAGTTAAGTPLMMATAPDQQERSQETRNRRTQQRSQRPEITFNPTYELNPKDLERQVQQDLSELSRRLDELERGITGGR